MNTLLEPIAELSRRVEEIRKSGLIDRVSGSNKGRI
jgi:hypothetical protein